MKGTIEGSVVHARCYIPVDDVEPEAREQIRRIASLPWVAHVAVMPDVHYGKGATVGSVIAMRGAVSPAAVGVDIGCGMAALWTSVKVDQLDASDLNRIYETICAEVPVGYFMHQGLVPHLENDALGTKLRAEARAHLGKLRDLREKKAVRDDRPHRQLGTLGGGNHFIEICADEVGDVWIMLHSGSRNIGKELAERHIEKARALTHNEALEDPDLAVFLAGTPEMAAYRHDLYWAQEYARLNRLIMLALVRSAVRRVVERRAGAEDSVWFGHAPVTCHHNYVAEERHFGEDLFVTRKGAIRAGTSDRGIIPGSMGARSYIVRGLGDPGSLESASHGAGRRMSRGAAKRKYTTEDLAAQTAGVVCRKDEGVVDEIPAAYKDIDQVMANQSSLVEVVHTLKGLVCVKG